jgi:hypothetical protein
MGLDTTYDCWHGSYGTFGWWRGYVFDAAFPEESIHVDAPMYTYLDLVEAWSKDDPRLEDPIMTLLLHSDCDGEIEVKDLLPLANRLELLIPKLTEQRPDWAPERAWTFINGLRAAHAAGEPVEFH